MKNQSTSEGGVVRVVILGAGGHAKVIADVLLNPLVKSKGFELMGFLDDNPDLLNVNVLGKPVLGKIADLEQVPHDAVVVGIGDNESRYQLFDFLLSHGEEFVSIIHPSAVIAPNVKLGVGTVVFAGVVVNSGCSIGDNVILNTGCTVDHDCIIASHSHICPGAHLGGGVLVAEGAWVGIGSAILHDRGVGEWSTIGGGATVVSNVSPFDTVVGVPAKALPPRGARKRQVYDILIEPHAKTLKVESSSDFVRGSFIASSSPVVKSGLRTGSSKRKGGYPNINVLFTSAGRRVELVRAFRNAYVSLGLDGVIVAIDADPLAPALAVADHSYVVPPLHSPEYISTLASICEKEKIRLVFPLIDPDIIKLSTNREIIERTGTEVVVLSEESVAITTDKWLTQGFYNRIGVPGPKCWLPGDLIPEVAPFPLFIKPRHGSAGKDSFKVENAEQLKFFSNYIPDPIIEDFLPGPEITNDVICDLKGKVLAVVSRERIEVRSGEVAKGVTIYSEDITKTCVKIAEALKVKGQITVQCIMKNGKPYFTEINARFGGGTPLGIASGCDAPRWLLAEVAGISITIPELGNYKRGLHVTRYDDSFYLTEDERTRIENSSFRP